MLGLSLDIPTQAGRRRGASPPFDPRSINPIALFDPSDLSSLSQDEAATVPVTTAGDPVGRLADLGVQGHSVAQSDPARKPIYQTDGTLHWIAADGSDDMLVHPSVALTPTLTICMAAEVTLVSSSTDALISCDAPSGDFQFDAGSGGSFEARFNSSDLGVTTVKAASGQVGAKIFTLVLDSTGGTVRLRIDGVESWVEIGYNGALSAVQVLNLFANRSTGSRIGAKLFAFAMWGDANLSRISNVENWAQGKAGL